MLLEKEPFVLAAHLFKLPDRSPNERQRKAARSFSARCHQQLRQRRHVLVYAPPDVPARQMSDLEELMDVLPHHHVFRWCTMGVADEDGKLIPWRVKVACTAPLWQGDPDINRPCGCPHGSHAIIPMRARLTAHQMNLLWPHVTLYLLIQLMGDAMADSGLGRLGQSRGRR